MDSKSKIVWPFAVKDLTPAAEYIFVKCGQWVDCLFRRGEFLKQSRFLSLFQTY